jgi:hypothetical protein
MRMSFKWANSIWSFEKPILKILNKWSKAYDVGLGINCWVLGDHLSGVLGNGLDCLGSDSVHFLMRKS